MAKDPFQLIGSALHDKYRVDEVIGEGGFGVVYRGFHLSFEQPIAIKCLKVPTHFTEEARALFLRKFREEGKHLAALAQHGSVTQVFDFGLEERPGGLSIPYLVLEWLEGRDLEEVLRQRREAGERFGEREALELLRPAIDALAFAHGDDIAHRDVKPANLFLAEQKRGVVLKVLDFGIAKAMQEGETATQIATKTSSGFSAFSPSYGAPEQFRTKKYGATGPWTDVHALGLILVEMVTGKPALDGEEMVDFFESATDDVRPTPRARGAEVSDAFEALCRRALALSPRERFADAGALLAAVDAALAGGLELTALLASEPGGDTVFQPPAEGAGAEVAVATPDSHVEESKASRTKKAAKTKGRGATEKAGRRVPATERWEGSDGGGSAAAPTELTPEASPSGPARTSRVLLWAGLAAGSALVAWLATRGPSAGEETSTPVAGSTPATGTVVIPGAVSPTDSPPDGEPSARRAVAPPLENPFPDDSPRARIFDLETLPPNNVAAPPPTAKRTSSGLSYVAKRLALGPIPGPKDRVKVTYTGWTTDGRAFDTTYRNEEPALWLDVGSVIAGLAEGLQLMRAGSLFQFWLPADLAYGDNPSGDKPAGMLVFKVELLAVEARSSQAAPRPGPSPHADPTGTSIYDSLTFRKPPSAWPSSARSASPPPPSPPSPRAPNTPMLVP